MEIEGIIPRSLSQQIKTLMEIKVGKVEGKGLSTNDYTNDAKSKVNKIDIYPSLAAANGLTLSNLMAGGLVQSQITNLFNYLDNNSVMVIFSTGEGSYSPVYVSCVEIDGILQFRLSFLYNNTLYRGTLKSDSYVVSSYNLNTMQTALSEKQDALVSGTNIKTINGNSVLGGGNIVIQGGGGEANVIEVVKRNGTVLTVTDKAVDVSVPTQPSDIGAAAASHTHDDRYYTTSQMDSALATKAPSSHAHTKSQITDFAHDHDDRYYTESETDTLLDTKQPTLVSGNNIKTVNSQSLLGNTNVKCSYVAEITNPSFPILTPSVTKTDTEMDEMGFTASVLADIMNGWVGRCNVVWGESGGVYSEIYTVGVAYKKHDGDYEFHLYSDNIIDDTATYYKIEYDHVSGNFTISVTEK